MFLRAGAREAKVTKRGGGESVKLNDRERRFVEEYMIDMNACAAAQRAGYTYATARNAAEWINPEHPKKPKLRQAIDRLMAAQSRRTGVTVERVIQELARIGFVNAADVIDVKTGRVRTDASRDDLATILSITVKDGECEVRLQDKVQSLKLLGMHLGAFAENIKLDGPVPVIIDDSGDCKQDSDSGKKIGYE